MFPSQVRPVLLSMVAYKTASRLNSSMMTERCFGTVITVYDVTLRKATKNMASFPWASMRMAENVKQNNVNNRQQSISCCPTNDESVGQTAWDMVDWQHFLWPSCARWPDANRVFSHLVAEGWCWGTHTLIITIVRRQENSGVLLTLLPRYVLPGTAATWQTSLTAAISGLENSEVN